MYKPGVSCISMGIDCASVSMNFGFNLGNILTVWYFVFLIIFHLNLIVHISMSFERSHVSISGEKVNDNLNMGSGSDLEFVKIRHAFLAGINTKLKPCLNQILYSGIRFQVSP